MRRIAAVLCALLFGWLAPSAVRAGVPKFCSGCSLAGASLPSSDFSNAVYVGTNFEGAKLGGSSFRDAKLVAANFQNADLRNVSFDGADCTACNFAGALLDGATFTKSRMVAANFQGFAAAVADAQLRELLGGCISCNFSASRLSGRDLSGIAAISVDFSGADLRGTNFAGAVLCWYDGVGTLRKTRCDKMKDAQTAGTNFRDAQLCDDPLARSICAPVSSGTLRQGTGAPLQGADLPQP